MFFTGDHHFGHAKIIEYCKRPFASVVEMDEAMIAAWNDVVCPKDEVWHLGDFAYRTAGDGKAAIFARLHGRKRLIIGNHDDKVTLALPWASPPVHLHTIKIAGRLVVLCHYGLRVWPGMSHGAISVYGHSHGRLPGNSLSLDVGVDCWDYRPVSIEEIAARMATLPDASDPEVREA